MDIIRWYDDKKEIYFQGAIEYSKEVFHNGDFKYYYVIDTDIENLSYKVSITEKDISEELINKVNIETFEDENDYYYFIDSQWNCCESLSAISICEKIKQKYDESQNFKGNIVIILYTSVYGGDEQYKIFNKIKTKCKKFAYFYSFKLIATSRLSIRVSVIDNALRVKKFIEEIKNGDINE